MADVSLSDPTIVDPADSNLLEPPHDRTAFPDSVDMYDYMDTSLPDVESGVDEAPHFPVPEHGSIPAPKDFGFVAQTSGASATGPNDSFVTRPRIGPVDFAETLSPGPDLLETGSSSTETDRPEFMIHGDPSPQGPDDGMPVQGAFSQLFARMEGPTSDSWLSVQDPPSQQDSRASRTSSRPSQSHVVEGVDEVIEVQLPDPSPDPSTRLADVIDAEIVEDHPSTDPYGTPFMPDPLAAPITKESFRRTGVPSAAHEDDNIIDVVVVEHETPGLSGVAGPDTLPDQSTNGLGDDLQL